MSGAYETINPWSWQDQFGFSQAVATPAASRWLFLAGQGPAAADRRNGRIPRVTSAHS